jgi:hypothetical protein
MRISLDKTYRNLPLRMEGARKYTTRRESHVSLFHWQVSSLAILTTLAPHHRQFKKAITADLGGIGFKSTVLGGPITAGSQTVGDEYLSPPVAILNHRLSVKSFVR